MRLYRLYTTAIFVAFIVSCCNLRASKATEVKWSAGDHDEKNAAHTAPKSQKYWDEHGIKRPDYAKTDAEIAQERGDSSGGGVLKWLLAIPIVCAAGYHFYLRMGGHKLGGTSHLFRRTSEEEARQARLAKFEPGKAE